MASDEMTDEMTQAITKYMTGDRAKISALKKRFESINDWTPPDAAAAIGYLIAKDELEAAKEEEEEPDVYDEVVEIIKKYLRPPGPNSTHMTADEIFTLIYEWLDKDLEVQGFQRDGLLRTEIRARFLPFIIKKPEA